MRLRTLGDLDVAGKRVLLRSDLNVPLDGGQIVDDFRIRASLPTIEALRARGAARVVIAAHLGRPKGVPDAAYSLAPVAARLAELLQTPVPLAPLPPGDAPPADGVALLENLRFDPRETRNDEGFARALAALADVYVDDAFGAVHRAHASVAAVAGLLPSAAGLLLAKEVETLSALRTDPARPYVAVVGGAKVSDKLLVLENLLRVVDRLLIGGAMCFTFFHAQGFAVGASLFEPDRVDSVRALLAQAGDRLVLPTDVVVAPTMRADARTSVVAIDAIPAEQAGYDIGPATVQRYTSEIANAKTVLWNGPMGVSEIDAFAEGTRALAQACAATSAYTVVGGGDSIAALQKFGYAARIDHACTGGGAMLEFLEGKELPGLTPLQA